MLERLRSPAFGRALVWVSALVLIAGAVAFVTVRWGQSSAPSGSVLPETVPEDIGLETQPTPKVEDVPRAARVAAGEFILPKAWRLSHPQLKRDCACSYREWLTGNIPVQPIEAAGLDQVSFFVDELAPRRVVLQVLVRAKPGSDFEDQAFYIGLKAVGAQRSWLVDLWTPISSIPIPLNPTGG
jgi:hypothetical protein